MKHKAVRVNDYNFTFQDRLFLDTNIWFYLYGPKGSKSHWVQIYSNVFNRILSAKSSIYIDVLVLSEFINTYARTQWRFVARHIESFKAFRNSSHFKPVAQEIGAKVKSILGHCSRIESGFSTLAIDDLITDYAAGNSDFNDQVITEICRSSGLTLITHDRDFKGQGITILTANRLLR